MSTGAAKRALTTTSAMTGPQTAMRGMHNTVRDLWSRLSGRAGRGRKHNFYEVFGWDTTIDPLALWEMYYRGGIAKRIVHAYPDAVWARPPEVTATQAFTNAWQLLVDDHKIWSVLHRLDKLSQIGRYAVLLVGTDRGRPQDQASGSLTYLQPYSDQAAVITQWVTNPQDPRFGLPLEYTIYPNKDAHDAQSGNPGSVGTKPSGGSFKVHHSRVVHVTQGQLESEVFGVPILYSVWNYLNDLNKVVGASAESYWLTANRGMQADIDKDMDLDEDDEAALAQEIDEYDWGLRRFIRTRGVEIKSLGSEVANPDGPYKVIINLISGTTSIPQRILTGSESGHNASTQDKGNWAEQIDHYRALTAGPHFLMPLIKGFMSIGILPTVATKKIKVEWPNSYVLSPLEEAQKANQEATAANNLGLAVKNVPNLMSVEEMRVKALKLPEKIPAGHTKPEPPVQGGTTDDENKTATEDGQSPDGGTPKTGPGSGNTATTGSDSNGSGDPRQDTNR